jgi:hypothetical protein
MDPLLFRVKEVTLPDDTVVTMIGTPDSRLYFRAVAVRHSWDRYCCEWTTFCPAFVKESRQFGTFLPFASAESAFREWLQRHAKPFLAETGLSDPWEIGLHSDLLAELSASSPADDTGFAPAEQAALLAALARFRNLVIAELRLEARQIATVDERLAYLSAALSRVNRLDWKNLALSSLVTIVTALSLNSEQGRHLLVLFRQAIASVAGLIP